MATTYIDNCIFCKILKSEAPSENVYEDDDVLCIKDRKPASTHHYLIMSKVHIPTAKDLKPDDEPLYDKMIDTVEVLCAQQGIDLGTVRTGFHWPPFTAVNHLHLHLIAPAENMGFAQRLIFKPDSFWFVSTDYVKSRFRAVS